MPASLPSLSAPMLTRELNARALRFAARHRLPHAVLDGRSASVLFCEHEAPGHGNFEAASHGAIRANPAWRARLNKPHTACRRQRARADWPWRELDCAVSSDALLMNIFCHPGVSDCSRLGSLLGTGEGTQPVFGVRPHLPMRDGLADKTEIDMQVGDLLVEAKLTETGFQTAPPALVTRFADLDAVFDREALPRTHARGVEQMWDEAAVAYRPVLRGRDGNYAHYQLVRGVLAAFASGLRFCVICDGRRTDLHEAWLAVQAAVRHAYVRWRLQLLTWQEIAACVPGILGSFLAEKYGIEAA